MIKTKLEELNLLDKFLFDETMEDREAYQAVVSILLESEKELLDRTETEKEFRISPELRQVRLDVIGMDREGTIYYTEMQQKNTENRRKRDYGLCKNGRNWYTRGKRAELREKLSPYWNYWKI